MGGPLIVLAAILLLAGIAAHPAHAQGGEDPLPPGVTWDQVNAVAHRMYCDVCQGVPLDECESTACREWRREIARLLGEGYTPDQIIDSFAEHYGEDVAAIPRNRADRRLAFLVPLAVVALMSVVGAVQMWHLRQRGQPAGQPVRRSGQPLRARPVPDDLDPDLLARLERELEGWIER
jgi:cytochrome c-type biogenesis protein CcmH/NrfF